MKVILLGFLCILTGCGHLDNNQVSDVMRRCLDAHGISHDSGPLLNGKHDVSCWMRPN